MEYYKGQQVKYCQGEVGKVYYGEVTRVLEGGRLPEGLMVSILWETGVQHDYYGDEAMLSQGKIEQVHKFSKNNPNRRFLEDGKKI